jgi:hypothetical protein
MIISASRRTDIPAFYSKWFMNRIYEGKVVVYNPYNKCGYEVSLNPKNIDAIVFWSKNYGPGYGRDHNQTSLQKTGRFT